MLCIVLVFSVSVNCIAAPKNEISNDKDSSTTMIIDRRVKLPSTSIDSMINDSTDSYDMKTISGLTVEQLEVGLLYNLKDYAVYFIKAEEDYGINALYLASISALESGWGRYEFKDNNIFGFGNMTFNHESECIDYVASFLSEYYLSEDSLYYSGGTTVYHVNIYYNGSDFWYDNVTSIADSILNRIQKEYYGDDNKVYKQLQVV